MANLKSSKKDIRRSTKRRLVNTGVKSALKTYLKKIKKAESPEIATSALTVAVKAIDKAAQNGTIHKNQAARRKSRAAKAANKVAAGGPVVAASVKKAKVKAKKK